MKSDIVHQYVSLRAALQKEKAQLEARLSQINRVLRGKASLASVPSRKTTRRKKRKMSAKARARISKAQKSRWAKLKARKPKTAMTLKA